LNGLGADCEPRDSRGGVAQFQPALAQLQSQHRSSSVQCSRAKAPEPDRFGTGQEGAEGKSLPIPYQKELAQKSNELGPSSVLSLLCNGFCNGLVAPEREIEQSLPALGPKQSIYEPNAAP